MCINRKDTHDDSGKQETGITHALLMGDKHTNLITNGMDACKGLTKKLVKASNKLRNKLKKARPRR